MHARRGWCVAAAAVAALAACSSPAPLETETSVPSSSPAGVDVDALTLVDTPPSLPARGALPYHGTERAPADQLVWSQEFDGPEGGSVEDEVWIVNDWVHNPEEGLVAWTPRPENVSLTGDGALRLTAREEEWEDPYGDRAEYTSGRLETENAFRYGRIEARINASAGQGTLTAFWMLGRYFDDAENWPAAGEIDIVEMLGDGSRAFGTVHGGTDIGGHWQAGDSLESSGTWANSWHVYLLDWEPDSITISVDDEPYFTFTREDLAEDQVWSFDEPQHILLTLAVGGDWAGDPTDPAAFPSTMLIDYIRVYGSELHPRL